MCFGGTASLAPLAGHAQVDFGVGIRVGAPPPPLPFYDQPPSPGYGYIWTPGYWAWSDYENDYYWVPGAWVLPPRIGYLWTPPWWGWNEGVYVFNPGYWGTEVGYYGGIDYGWGYGGYGYEGGYWRGRDFVYNRAVNNIRNIGAGYVYDRPVRGGGRSDRLSFNGPGGVQARPSAQQMYAARGQHLAPTSAQQQHIQFARTQPDLRAGFNHGAPPMGATARPAMSRGPEATPAMRAGGPYAAQGGPGRAPWTPALNGRQQGPSERFNGGDYGAYHGAVGRPAPAPATQRYGGEGGGSAMRGYAGYNAEARFVSRPPETLNAGFRPARTPETFGGGGFRPSPQGISRAPQPVRQEGRPAAQSAAGVRDRRDPGHP
jgi:hypothetical protein